MRKSNNKPASEKQHLKINKENGGGSGMAAKA